MKKVLTFVMIMMLLFGSIPCRAETDTEKAMFTERDLSGSYDVSKAVTVDLTAQTAAAGVDWEGSTCRIQAEGTYLLTGRLNGELRVAAAKDAKVQLVLQGVDITGSGASTLVIESADKVFITLSEDTINSLTATGNAVKEEIGTLDGVIFTKSDLTINGAGQLTIIGAVNGIEAKDDFKMTGGDVTIEAGKHGVKANDSIRICGGNLLITCGNDGLHTDGDDEDAEKGWILMQNGTLTINAGDDAVHAATSVSIAGGVVQIPRSHEGLEGQQILISGGDIHIVAEDDGINASDGNGGSEMNMSGWGNMGWDRGGKMGGGGNEVQANVLLSISGGRVDVQSGGDGLDSNGNMAISGGVITVSGPINSGDVPVDYNGTGPITGGTVIATGVNSRMLQGFDASSTQSSTISMLGQLHQPGDTIIIADSTGNVLAEYTPAHAYQLVVFSVAGVNNGDTLTLTCGSEVLTVTAGSSAAYGSYNAPNGGFGEFNNGLNGHGGRR